MPTVSRTLADDAPASCGPPRPAGAAAPGEGTRRAADGPGRESAPVGRQDDEFTLANERTFLSWIRTALALLAGGVLLEQFAARLQPRAVVVALAVVLALLSATMCGLAYFRWRSHEAAVREGRPLSGSLALPLTAAVMVAVAATIAAMIALQWFAG